MIIEYREEVKINDDVIEAVPDVKEQFMELLFVIDFAFKCNSILADVFDYEYDMWIVFGILQQLVLPFLL